MTGAADPHGVRWRQEPGAGIGVVTLARAPVNALDAGAFGAAATALRELTAAGVRAIVITGEGSRAFCAGTDLAAFGSAEALAAVQETSLDFFETLADLPVPLVGALNGPAVGGGAMIASECDVLVAVPDAYFSIPEVAAEGLLGGGSHVRRLAPYFKGLRMLLLGERLTAQDALAAGVVAAVVERDELDAAAADWAGRLAALDPAAVRHAREIFRGPEGRIARAGYRAEQQCLRAVLAARAPS